MREAVEYYVKSLGWRVGREGELIDPHGDYLITFEDDLWRLAKFDDSDNPYTGIAEARWLNRDEGETLNELKFCLREIGYGLSVKALRGVR